MDSRQWITKLEAEIASELGQPIKAALGGAAPESSRAWANTLELSAVRMALAVDSDDLRNFLIEGRLIDAAQADATMVQDLWRGILESVSARLGGKVTDAQVPPGRAPEPFTLRLGDATLRMALDVEPAVNPVSRVEMPEASAAVSGATSPGNYDLLLEVELDAAVRFGSRELELRELLELGPGDVVELDRHLTDPVDLIVGDKIVARGEVVLVNGNFGLRVTEVAEPIRRLESIRCLS